MIDPNPDELVFIRSKFGKMSYFKNDDCFADSAIKHQKIWEQDLIVRDLSKIINKSRVILDVGAHCGSHTVVYKSLNTRAKILAFEPQKRLYELLEYNVALNKLEDVTCYNYAIGNKTGQVEMNNYSKDGIGALEKIEYGTDSTFNLGGIEIGSGGESVEMIRIDDLELDSCDFIKIDVEGYEPLVLEGAKETVLKFRPTILFEEANKLSSEAERTASEILLSMDYSIRSLDGVGDFLATATRGLGSARQK